MFVEGVSDLQPTNEGGSGYVLVRVVYQGHLTLKVVDIILQALFGFHLGRKDMVVVPPKLPPKSKLVVECVSHVMKILE